MELQFHTPQSFDVKQNLTHDLYEQQRVLSANDPLNSELRKQIIETSRVIQIPPNIQTEVPNVQPPKNQGGQK
jgi:hypothetical protein